MLENQNDANFDLGLVEPRLAAEADAPLPDRSTWHEYGGAELEPHLTATTIINVCLLYTSDAADE